MSAVAPPVRLTSLRSLSPRLGGRQGLGRLVVLGLLAASCSKGGAADPDSTACRKLSDQDPDPDHPLPKTLFAELRNTPIASSTSSTAIIPLNLDEGSGGDYSGNYTFTKCEQPDTYYVERLVLVSSTMEPVAVAVRNGANYNVTYQKGGGSTVATGFSGNAVSYTATGGMPSLKVTTLTATPNMVKLGEQVNIQVAVGDETCGVRESQWWLAGPTPSATSIDPTVISGGSGQASLRISPKRSIGTYYVEGQVTLKGGRVIQVRRNASTDTQYMLIDKSGAVVGNTSLNVVSVAVSDNPDADRMPAIPLSMDAVPASVGRCQPVNISLRLFDDRGLPASQPVKVFVGPAESPKLVSLTLTGGDLLSGSFVLPSDAPPGIWYGYPESIRDAAGNQSLGTLSNGKFTTSDGTNTSQAVMAATFIVPNPNPIMLPDLSTVPDGGVVTPPPDMAAPPFPATLTVVNITPTTAKEGDNIVVRMKWNDIAMILK